MTCLIKASAAAAVWLALGGAALAQSTSSQPTSSQPASRSTSSQSCFYDRDISNFNAVSDSTVYLRVGVSKVYRLDLMSPCTGLTYRQRVGIKTTPGSRWICSPLDAEVVYSDNGFPQRCPVTGLHALTPAEVAALPKKDRP
jgi:hypothetical protein